MQLYDYIYVDLDKATSLYSQLTGGVVELRESNVESSAIADNKRKYDFKVFKHDAGGSTTDKEQLKEVIKPYHAFLIELEQLLEKEGHLINLDSTSEDSSLRDESFRQHITSSFAMKVTGRSVIEDYERIKGIAKSFPDVISMINKSSESNVKETSEYEEIASQIEELESSTKSIKDRNKRNQATQLIKQHKKSLDGLVSSRFQLEAPQEWVLDGLQTWIDTFLPGIVNLRVYPSSEHPDEHVFGHLKRDCFCDNDSSSFHFTYGSMPTGNITIVGVIASVPSEESEDFDPMKEFIGSELMDYEVIEKAFRGVFRGFDGFEQMIRTSRFPRVMLYPVLVYRTVTPNK